MIWFYIYIYSYIYTYMHTHLACLKTMNFQLRGIQLSSTLECTSGNDSTLICQSYNRSLSNKSNGYSFNIFNFAFSYILFKC